MKIPILEDPWILGLGMVILIIFSCFIGKIFIWFFGIL